MLDLPESGNADRNETKELRKSIDQALASVLEDLAALFEIHCNAEDRSKTQMETENIEAEYDSIQAEITRYLDSIKEETQSQASGNSTKWSIKEETLSLLQQQESIAKQHSSEIEERVQIKEESILLAPRKLDEEYLQRQKELEKEMQDIHGEFGTSEGDIKYRFNKREAALDGDFSLSKPSLRDKVRTKKQDQQSPILERQDLGKDMWKQLTRVSIPVLSSMVIKDLIKVGEPHLLHASTKPL